MTITKREILIGIIVSIFFIVSGLFISNYIGVKQGEVAEKYYKALKIDNDVKMFDYNIKTNGGNTLTYGNGIVVDPVSVPELNGEYAVIVKYTERYEKHIEYEEVEDEDGDTHIEEVIRYSWDRIHTDTVQANTVLFLEKEFPVDIFNLGTGARVDLENQVSEQYKNLYHFGYLYKDADWFEDVGDIRWYFTVVPTEFKGSLFANFNGETITKKNAVFYREQSIEDVIEEKKISGTVGKVIFWIFWIIFVAFCVIMFLYAENHWLED